MWCWTGNQEMWLRSAASLQPPVLLYVWLLFGGRKYPNVNSLGLHHRSGPSGLRLPVLKQGTPVPCVRAWYDCYRNYFTFGRVSACLHAHWPLVAIAAAARGSFSFSLTQKEAVAQPAVLTAPLLPQRISSVMAPLHRGLVACFGGCTVNVRKRRKSVASSKGCKSPCFGSRTHCKDISETKRGLSAGWSSSYDLC